MPPQNELVEGAASVVCCAEVAPGCPRLFCKIPPLLVNFLSCDNSHRLLRKSSVKQNNNKDIR